MDNKNMHKLMFCVQRNLNIKYENWELLRYIYLAISTFLWLNLKY